MLKKLEIFFETLEREKIPYVIWKSLENIDQALFGKDDLDILFDPKDSKRVKSVMRSLVFPEDYRSIGKIGQKIRVFRGIDQDELKPIMIHVHFECRFGSKKYKEFRFPKESLLLANSKIYQGARTLKDEYFLLTRVLIAVSKEKIDPFLANWLKELKDRKEETGQYEKVFALVKTNLREIIESVDKNQLRKIKDKLISEKTLIKNSFLKIFLRKITRTRIRISRSNKIGFKRSVVLRGGDGVGKSTLANVLSGSLNPFGPTKIIYLGRNKWSLFNNRINQKRTRKGFGFLNFIWPITSSTEILFRYLKGKIYSYLGRIVIYDRSLEDLKIKFGGSGLLLSWFPLLVSKLSSPRDLKYLLHADPEIIKKRGDSHSPEELAEIQKIYSEQSKNFKKIDTSLITPTQTASIIIGDILSEAAKK